MKSIFLISIFATIVTAQRGHGPKCIQNFYDKILNKPGFFGQNLSLIQETLHDDWNTRPNPLDPTGMFLVDLRLKRNTKLILDIKFIKIKDTYVHTYK